MIFNLSVLIDTDREVSKISRNADAALVCVEICWLKTNRLKSKVALSKVCYKKFLIDFGLNIVICWFGLLEILRSSVKSIAVDRLKWWVEGIKFFCIDFHLTTAEFLVGI